ncbi:glycerophosphodiester phosphodiesterase [Bacillus andreraoultii]|uniref:glycerophosphodiester phosphodiesterase n=1 Tax=Bacillus andreraoultii TaxID=1499685 RepID=UPI00053A092B|nr:glycerophosphodiester phosphodiesterase [Bacillus andreraoultii]
MTLIFGHRGSAGTYPENTMLSFKEAAQSGADGIELDVQLTRDGEIVIIHDQKVDRTTNGKGLVKNFTLKEIKQLNAGANFQKGKYEADIPTLEEVLVWLSKTDLLINIEFKSFTIDNHDLEEKTVQFVRKYKLEERTIFSSFNHYAIVYCYRIAPEIETAPLYSEGLFMPWIYAESIKSKAIHPHYRVAPKRLVEAAQSYGINVRPYTVNKEDEIRRYIDWNTAAIITDYPELARIIRDE